MNRVRKVKRDAGTRTGTNVLSYRSTLINACSRIKLFLQEIVCCRRADRLIKPRNSISAGGGGLKPEYTMICHFHFFSFLVIC